METKTEIMEKIETIIGTYHASRCAYEDDDMEDVQDRQTAKALSDMCQKSLQESAYHEFLKALPYTDEDQMIEIVADMVFNVTYEGGI